MRKLSQADADRLAKAVADILGKIFKNIEIVQVLVTPDHDHDGDEILRIDVIFKGVLKEADAKHVAGAARHLLPALEKFDPDIYPLLSFVSKVDYDRGHKSEAH
jgi:hypothetical protein